MTAEKVAGERVAGLAAAKARPTAVALRVVDSERVRVRGKAVVALGAGARARARGKAAVASGAAARAALATTRAAPWATM